MTQKGPLAEIRNFLNQYVSKWPDVFLVDVSVSITNKTSILLDADSGLNIAKCADVNRALYKFVQQEDIFEGNNFSIEVSSPGIGSPLKLVRQYVKNIGRTVEVIKKSGDVIAGKLLEVGRDSLKVEEIVRLGKKIEQKKNTILFEEIDQIKVLLTF